MCPAKWLIIPRTVITSFLTISERLPLPETGLSWRRNPDIRAEAGGGAIVETNAQENPDAKGERSVRSPDLSGENGETQPRSGEVGGLESGDEASVAGQGRGRRNENERDGYVSLAFAEESEATKPSRDYRISSRCQDRSESPVPDICGWP